MVLFPADTVYGLGFDPDSSAAVRRLYEFKGRPAEKPAAVMFFALALTRWRALPELRARERDALGAALSGPLTLLLQNRAGRYPFACGPARVRETLSPRSRPSGRDGSARALGLRVPLLAIAYAALAHANRALMQSSANLSGGSEARRLADVPGVRSATAPTSVLDGGALPGQPSTVIDLCN